MVPVEVFDEHDDVQAEGEDNGVDLNVAAKVSLPNTAVSGMRRTTGATLACLRVDRKSIIFCTARVPCIFREMLTSS